jgi:hypothetical protein
MHILNYQNFVETRQKHRRGAYGRAVVRRDPPPPAKEIKLAEEFGQYAVTYPDGRTITLYQDGRITETPKNGKEHAIKLSDKTFIT